MSDIHFACDLLDNEGITVQTIEVHEALPAVIATPDGCYVYVRMRSPREAVYVQAMLYQHGGQFVAWEIERAGFHSTGPNLP
jgi:hypothetical protein